MKRPGRKQHGTKKVLGLVMVVGIIAAGTYAFTAGNTVPDSNAGDGSAPAGVTGYVVSSLDYNENATNPDQIDSVDFELDGDADRVRVQLVAGGPWYDCALPTGGGTILDPITSEILGTQWECPTSGATAASVDQFRVLAYEDNNDV